MTDGLFESADERGAAARAAWRAGEVSRAGDLATEAIQVDPDSLTGWQVSAEVAPAGIRRVERDNEIRADRYSKGVGWSPGFAVVNISSIDLRIR